MAIDYESTLGQVRLLIPDVDESNLLLSDAQISAVLSIEASNVKRAAASCVLIVARNEALLLKVMTIAGAGNVTTDGSRLAAELRKHAEQLRAEAEEDDSRSTAGFDWAPIVATPAQYSQQVWSARTSGV